MLELAFAFGLGYLLRSVIAQVANVRLGMELQQALKDLRQALDLDAQ